MGAVETLVSGNEEFARSTFDGTLRMKPKLATVVIGCVDARVDPAVVLGAAQGEIMAIRNVGGRVTPRTLEELIMLRAIAGTVNDDFDSSWELIVMQHTQCGLTRIHDRTELLAPYFDVAESDLGAVPVTDPYAAVARDVSLLRADGRLGSARVSGLVYDVATGRVESVGSG
ncbi:carbonic anhydrase [Streptomyces sp. NPDC058653]|uniref:carbonic anhydrase n=1 Tax=Streptomyces sp. NPDC058653 TaxID=3346576 RepID=UPI003651A131